MPKSRRRIRVKIASACRRQCQGPEYPFTARTEGNLLVCVRGDDIKIGEFIEAEIEKTSLRCLFAHKL
ncbi:MAG: TRAM domain-containing protein [Butyricicoccus sp.]